jgi:hypothetical protein
VVNRALGTVRRWRFRPAIGEDGKPKASLRSIQV